MYLSLSTCIALLVAALSYVFSLITTGLGLLPDLCALVTLAALALVAFKGVQAARQFNRYPLPKDQKHR